MKKILIAILALAAMPLAAQEYGQNRTVKIWDNASAPHSNGITTAEVEQSPMIIGGTSEAVLYIFEADPAVATGQAMVICPGGGYAVVCMGYEGVDMARWLASKGITCGVLKYRMPNGHREVPLEDAVEALRTMRRMSSELKIDPARVGIMGFSAGGHLAAYTSNFADDADKPAFSVLFYPVITGEAWLCHKGSFDNLLGADASEAERALDNASRHTPALGRRYGRAPHKQHPLLQRPEEGGHRGIDAHISHGRPRMGHKRGFPLPRGVAAGSARLALAAVV